MRLYIHKSKHSSSEVQSHPLLDDEPKHRFISCPILPATNHNNTEVDLSWFLDLPLTDSSHTPLFIFYFTVFTTLRNTFTAFRNRVARPITLKDGTIPVSYRLGSFPIRVPTTSTVLFTL